MGTYAYDATNDTLDLIAGRGNTDTIESQIGYVEPTDTATSAHAVGSYFINKLGQFVKATAAIAVGDTIAVGTNVVATDIAGVLSELNNNKLSLILTKSDDSQGVVDRFTSRIVPNLSETNDFKTGHCSWNDLFDVNGADLKYFYTRTNYGGTTYRITVILMIQGRGNNINTWLFEVADNYVVSNCIGLSMPYLL